MTRPPLSLVASFVALVAVAAQPALKIPLREGLTIVTAIYQPERGDFESIKTILRASDKDVRLKYAAEAPASDEDDNPLAGLLGGGKPKPKPQAKRSGAAAVEHVNVTRTVTRQDLREAHEYRWNYANGAPESYPGSTALGVSTAVLTELKTKGRSDIKVPEGGVIGALSGALGGLLGGGASALGGAELASGTLKRVEPGTVPFQVLLNGEPAQLPAVHARGQLGDDDAEFWILDDAENPLSLKWTMGGTTLQVIKLAFPREASATTAASSGADRIERDLAKDGRAIVYGIYFDFASDRIKEESEPVLKEIADVLAKNPTWKLSVEGHTDSIGGSMANLDLSKRRAAAVKTSLTAKYRVTTDRLVTGGFGATRPKDTNETMEGRARNRRVELVKQ